MTDAEGSERDTKGDDELEPAEGAETKADLDEEGGQANRPGDGARARLISSACVPLALAFRLR